jgi:hypothetical protein
MKEAQKGQALRGLERGLRNRRFTPLADEPVASLFEAHLAKPWRTCL